jgi:hypothetical protein
LLQPEEQITVGGVVMLFVPRRNASMRRAFGFDTAPRLKVRTEKSGRQRTESADAVKTVGLGIVKAGAVRPGKRQNKPIGKWRIDERGSLLNRIKARRHTRPL